VGGPELYQWLVQTGLAICLIIVAIVNATTCIFALDWVSQPFPGLLLEPTLVISGTGNPNWPAFSLGTFGNPDRLLAINGQPVHNSSEIAAILKGASPGENVRLTIERQTDEGVLVTKEFSVPLTLFPFSDFLVLYWIPLILAFTYLGLGFWVFRLKGNQRPGQTFTFLCASISLITGLFFDMNTTHRLASLWTAAIPMAAAAAIHLALVFPEETTLIRRYPLLRFIPYLAALPLIAWGEIALVDQAHPRAYFAPWRWSFAFAGLAVCLFVALLLYTRRTTSSAEVRQQVRILLLGAILGLGPLLLYSIPAMLRQPTAFPPVLFFFLFAVFLAAIAYAILHYRLLNVDLVISQGLAYSAVVLGITAAYFLLISALGALLQTAIPANSPIVLAIFVLILVAFLGPVKERVQRLVDRLFYRERKDYRLALQEYGRNLTATRLDLSLTLDLLVKRVMDSLHPERVLVFLYDGHTDAYVVHKEAGTPLSKVIMVHFAQDSDLARLLRERDETLSLVSPAGEKLASEERARLNALGVTLCVPLRGKQRLTGWMALGRKRSEEPYDTDDLLFLTTLSDQTAIAIENAQLLEEAQQRARSLAALQETFLDIAAQLETSQLLKAIVERATNLLRARGGAIYLCDNARKTLRVVACYNLDQDYTGLEIAYGQGVAGRVAESGEFIMVEDYQRYNGRPSQYEGTAFGAVVGVPLKWGGEVRGVLDILHEPGGPGFSDDDIWLLSLFANQAAIALENARLYQNAWERARKLSTLYEVGRTISSTLNLQEVLDLIMVKAVEILDAEAGSLLLLDERGRELIFQVAIGPTGKQLLDRRLPVGTGLAGAAAQEGQAIIVNDVKADPRWNVTVDESTQFVTRSVLAVPMVSKERVIGVIEVINKRSDPGFDEEDASLLTAFASQAAVAIENARLYSTTDQILAERVCELSLMQAIDRQLNATLDLGRVMNLTIARAMGATKASAGVIGMLDESRKGMTLLAQKGYPKLYGRYRKELWPIDRGIVGRVVRTGQPALVGDVSQDPDYFAAIPEVRSELAAPLLREGKVTGVIYLESTEPDAFDEEDLAFVTRLADHAAIAVTNAFLYEEVKKANEAKSEFVSMVAHELKIPMTSIKGYARLLDMGAAGEVSDTAKDFLSTIGNNVDRMDRLVQDLLDIARIEAGRLHLEMGPVSLKEVVDDVVKAIRKEIEERGLSLAVAVPEDLPQVWGDRNRLAQVLTNLLSNAYKYTRKGGEIRLVVNGQAADRLEISVSDTGIGISPEDQSKLFTKFFRADDPTVREVPGSGLGLSIVKNLVEMHGGQVWVKSEPGVGSTFTFSLPLSSAQNE
jgi:signal transduction histidine kinase